MISKLVPEIFIKKSKTIPVIDVRAPAEFEKGHIPGAYNIPLFNNEERAQVGTLYKQTGREQAILRGLEIVGPKLAGFVKEAGSLAANKERLVYCWRGGMRSSSFGWLLQTADMQISLLEGGYKAYRKFIRKEFLNAKKIIVLGGMTGSGKTEILHALQKKGEQILDLEGLANHKGSAFGTIGQDEQPVNEQFENKTYAAWEKFDLNKKIWIEDESLKIGKVVINENLYKMMRQAPLIKLIIPRNIRVERLEKDYCRTDKAVLKEMVIKIRKRLGELRAREIIENINTDNFKAAINSVLDYYDKSYLYGNSKRDRELVHELKIDSGDADFCAGQVLDFVKKLQF